MSKRLSLKDLKKPDRFLHILQDASGYIEKNPRVVLWALLAIVIVLVGGGFTWSWNEKRKEAARSQYYIVSKELNDSLVKVKEEIKKPTNPKVPEPPEHLQIQTPLNVDEKLGAQIQKMKEFIQNYKNSLPAFRAQVELGNLYFDNGFYESAAEFYRAASRSAPNKIDEGLVNISLGYTLENLNQFDKAIEAFEKALKSLEPNLMSPKDKTQSSTVKGDVLLALGRVYALAQVPEKAGQMYDQVIREFPKTPFAEKAEIQKMMLGN